MAIRDNLKSNLDVSLSGSNVAVSSELPYTTGGEALYNKNMKKLYLDEDNISKTELINCLDNNDVVETETTVTGFLSVDAKNLFQVYSAPENIETKGSKPDVIHATEPDSSLHFQLHPIWVSGEFKYLPVPISQLQDTGKISNVVDWFKLVTTAA